MCGGECSKDDFHVLLAREGELSHVHEFTTDARLSSSAVRVRGVVFVFDQGINLSCVAENGRLVCHKVTDRYLS